MQYLGKNVVPILMIAASIWGFFGFLQPGYGDIGVLRAEKDEYKKYLDNAKEGQVLRDKLLASYRSFTDDEWHKLQTLLPDKVDAAHLSMQVSALAESQNIVLKSLTITEVEDAPEAAPAADTSTDASVATPPSSLGKTKLTMGFEGTYAQYQNFLHEMERNLELFDVSSIKVSRTDDKSDRYHYDMEFLAYWLKQK